MPEREQRGGAARAANADEVPPEAGVGGPDAWTGGPGHAPVERGDDELTGAVHAALDLEPSVDGRRVHVETTDGIVRLHGVVGSQGERDHAIRAVETVAGVKRVEDHLQVMQRGGLGGESPS